MVPLSSEALRRELLTLLAIMYRWGGRRAQAYNLSLGPSTHDQLVAVTSTRRASVTHRVTGEGPGLRASKDLERRGSPLVAHCVPFYLKDKLRTSRQARAPSDVTSLAFAP